MNDLRLRVLLVDDDEDDYIIVRHQLSEIEGRRFDLDWAATYDTALETVGRQPYDVCLIDYRLGGRDGLEFMRRAMEIGCRAPMILLTGQGGRELDVEAMRAGAADYLVKGQIDATLLERSIRYAIERVRGTEALRESERRFRSIVETMPIPVAMLRPSDGMILYANGPLGAFVGLSSEALAGRPMSGFFCDPGDWRALMDDLRGEGPVHNREVQGRRTDGASIWMNVSAQTITFEGAPAILAGFYDVTERRRTEQELIRLERLRALGEMSAGVSHNLNNILVSVLGPAQLLHRETSDPRALRRIDEIIGAARRARDLVQRLHRAVRAGERALQPVQVGKVVQEAVQAAQPRWKDESEAKGVSIEVRAQCDDALPPIQGAEVELHDILLNLLFNAVDAMPRGGVIAIRAQAAGGGVELTVSDTGVGMDEETRRRVFEPFFTTKVNVGTGLGLATVYSTAIRWGGAIDVRSAPGQGTTFTLRLPAWTEPVKKARKRPAARRSRRGRVLIVEDDPNVLSTLSDLLAGRHEVEVFPGGEEALKAFAPGRYDVALIDLGMPRMPGDRVALEVRRMDPAAVTVLITGWELDAADPRLSSFDFRIQKPFEDLDEVTDVMARAVRLHDTRTGRR